MVNAIEAFDAKHMKPAEEIPDFRPGDTVDVNVKIKEGNNSRIQTFTGVVIARQGAGVRETFVVRKISFGTGVERRFPLHSPSIDSIKLVRRGRVRRAKLYYLRALRGKAARIVERRDNKATKALVVRRHRKRECNPVRRKASGLFHMTSRYDGTRHRHPAAPPTQGGHADASIAQSR